MKITQLKIKSNNPRKIDEPQIQKLMQSIKDFPAMMELRPIVYDPVTMEVLGGNQRLTACKKLGMKELPDAWVRSADSLTEDEKRRFVIQDNHQSGDWDFEILNAEWGDIDLEGIGIVLPDGYDAGTGEEQDDDYETPDNVQTIETNIKRGDIIEIGRHRLMCGDSASENDVSMLMNGHNADMILTDPPYGISYEETKNWAKPDYIKRPIVNDDKPFIFGEYAFPKARCYSLWGANYFSGTITNYSDGNYIVWAKAHSEEENKVFGSSFELCWQYPKHKQEIWFERRINMNREEYGLHPTQKPVSVIKRCIEYHKTENPKYIIDLFIGSGSTMVACHQLDRICYGMEISPQYCQVVIDRMKKLDADISVKINGEKYVG